MWSFVVLFLLCRVLCCCGVVLVVSCVVCVCVCDLFLPSQEAATESLRYKMQARNKVAVMQEVMRVWHAAIPPQLRAVLLTAFDLQLVAAASDSVHPGVHQLASPTGADADTPATAGAAAVVASSAAVPPEFRGPFNSNGAALGSVARWGGGGDGGGDGGADGGSGARDTVADAESDEDASRLEEEGGGDSSFVLDSDCTASPWRTLGALAIKAALGDGSANRASVWEEARRTLQGARLSRLGVVSLVEDASSSSPKRNTGRGPSFAPLGTGRVAPKLDAMPSHDEHPASSSANEPSVAALGSGMFAL